MEPGQNSPRPTEGNQPYPRSNQSIDGVSRRPAFGRPATSRDFRQPVAPRRPVEFSPPPVLSQPTPLPTQQQPQAQPAAPIPQVPQPPITPLSFEPKQPEPKPPKIEKPRRRIPRKVLAYIAVVILGILIIGAIAGLVMWQMGRNKPENVFSDALKNSLQTTSVQTQTDVNGDSVTANLDFSDPTNPISSSKASLKISGADFKLSGYGSVKNQYVSYVGLPKSIPAPLAAAATNAWIQTKVNGVQPAGVSATLSNLANPGYQGFGPIVVGNFNPKVRKQLIQYAQAQNIYKYDVKKVTSTTIGDTKVLAFPVKLDVSYLKLLNQSAAGSKGISLNDAQTAANAMDVLKGTTTTIYVAKGTHKVVRVGSVGKNFKQTVDYRDYGSTSVTAEPQTKLSWPGFANYQLQIETKAAAGQTAAQRDEAAKAKLAAIHTALANYYITNSIYPSLNNLNDQTWVAANLAGFDPDYLHDPLGISLAVASTPKANIFAYQPKASDGKTVCDGSPTNLCAHYVLTATLSNKQLFTVQDP